MSPAELLDRAETAGITLTVRGDRLLVRGPATSYTPELRAELLEHKAAIVALLTPQFVSLKGGLVVPVPALRLALDLEDRGFALGLDDNEQFTVAPLEALTAGDRAGITRWRAHLGAIVGYRCEPQ